MLTNNNLIDVWEQGAYISPFEYGNLLLRYACDDLDDLDSLSMGERERLLLELRAKLFGVRIQAESICGDCSEKMDIDFNVDDIIVNDENETETDKSTLIVDGMNVVIKPVNVGDMRTAIKYTSGNGKENILLEKCVLSIKKDQKDIQLSQLNDTAVNKIVGGLSKLDPQSEIVINYTCPSCESESSHIFDICSYMSREISQYVQDLFIDVHWLSSAYGWRESDILSMSKQRRKLYMGMISA